MLKIVKAQEYISALDTELSTPLQYLVGIIEAGYRSRDLDRSTVSSLAPRTICEKVFPKQRNSKREATAIQKIMRRFLRSTNSP